VRFATRALPGRVGPGACGSAACDHIFIVLPGGMLDRFCNSGTRPSLLSDESSPACGRFATRGVSVGPRMVPLN
jgi:hypothetical protein